MQHAYSMVYQNIRIRPLQTEDIESLRLWRNDPQNTKYLTAIPHISSEQQKHWFQRYLQSEDELTFAVDEIASLGRLAGSLALYHFEGNQVELGRILIGDPQAHGKNVGYHAIVAAIATAFRCFPVKKIVLQCYKDNCRALHIYRKAEFKITDCHLSQNGEEYTMELDKASFQERFPDIIL